MVATAVTALSVEAVGAQVWGCTGGVIAPEVCHKCPLAFPSTPSCPFPQIKSYDADLVEAQGYKSAIGVADELR